MRQRFYLYKRRDTYYLEDSQTKKQQSLETRDWKVARRLLEIKRQAAGDPSLKQIILRTFLSAQDSLLPKRTWETVMEQMALHGKKSTRERRARAMKSRAFDSIRAQKLIETTCEDFLATLNASKVSANHYLRRLHNLALGLGWLPSPVLAPKLWPKPRFKRSEPSH
jgi:hypothetical protein